MAKLFPAATPHGSIQQIFENVFVVLGSVVMGPGIQISRSMTIVRENDELTLISAIRLNEDELNHLESLGKIKNVVRLGAYHLGHMNGLDDGFYLDRYDAKLWLLPEMDTKIFGGETAIMSSTHLPLENADLFVYESSPMPEAILILNQHDGIAISADSLQNWWQVDEYFSEQAGVMMTKAGFIKGANIGPEWKRANNPSAEDFNKVKELPFKHLLPSHGTPILNDAKHLISATINQQFDLLSVG